MPDDCLWLGSLKPSLWLSLALSVCKSNAIFFASTNYVSVIDCFSVMVYCISYEASMGIKQSLFFSKDRI